MSKLTSIPDADERINALDPEQSFIVQAPAGSGKTGLLIQRYLKLLACVEAPEEIIAITFTRKAAAEMRERVLIALTAANNTGQVSDNAYEKLTNKLALAVLQQDHQFAWNIIENPIRLRIQTIDSLCAALTKQMPILSEFGAQLETIENASELYLAAARATIELVESDTSIAQDVEQLLVHLDNDVARIETLLAEMLAQRDHWLRHIHGTREELQEALQNIRHDAIVHIANLYPKSLQSELLALIHYAAANLASKDEYSPIIVCGELETLLDSDVSHWRAIATLLLTDKGTWRKQLTVRNGFPPGKTKSEKEITAQWKARALALIEVLQNDNSLCQALHGMRSLPEQAYTDTQWQVLGAITKLLWHAVIQLKVTFQLSGKVDFTEVAQAASLALGEPEMPTDLALALDYRIQHLLIDEFQDTSISQYQLIEKLVAEWQTEDGRSLFIVGDPMQSIYRFREAEVGLFLRARNEGIGNVFLQPLTLCANFRSQSGIVDWVNSSFSQIMPSYENITAGAVPYTHSVATNAALTSNAVNIYPFFNKDYVAEAKQVVEIILQEQRNHSTTKTAILVRNRGHLTEIVAQLKKNNLAYRALEIEPLCYKPVVQDLLMLTRALIHFADRLAWFALLRAPWCGLTLKDLHALTLAEKNPSTVWEIINDEKQLNEVSSDGNKRLLQLRKILTDCINNRHRQPLRETVEAAWMALGGPGCLVGDEIMQNDRSLIDLEDAMIFFNYLESHEVAGEIPDLANFEKELTRLYAMPDSAASDQLQIMTIHKAKGLEFDCVIVPGLGRASRNSDKQLLKWMERPKTESDSIDLVLAPIQETGTDSDLTYTWLQNCDDDKTYFEDQRLLYVAATRARNQLHLLGNIDLVTNKQNTLELKPPALKTLLNKLWPIVHYNYAEAAKQVSNLNLACSPKSNEDLLINQSSYRVTSDWDLPVAPASVAWNFPQQKSPAQEEIEFSWSGEIARHTGKVVHHWLQHIAEDNMIGWNAQRINALHKQFRQALIASGMVNNNQEIEKAVERVINALTRTISDSRGQWLLGPQQHAKNEIRMTGVINNKLVNLIIDRTFCDANNIRWIIDYKTSSHEGADLNAFLDSEQERYSAQLNTYALLIRQFEKKEIRLGLYFPLLMEWREWRYLK